MVDRSSARDSGPGHLRLAYFVSRSKASRNLVRMQPVFWSKGSANLRLGQDQYSQNPELETLFPVRLRRYWQNTRSLSR